jgi:hypothetical protein
MFDVCVEFPKKLFSGALDEFGVFEDVSQSEDALDAVAIPLI